MRILDKRKAKGKAEYWKIMVGDFLNLMKDMHTYPVNSMKTANKMNSRKPTLRHILTKHLKLKKKRILNAPQTRTLIITSTNLASKKARATDVSVPVEALAAKPNDLNSIPDLQCGRRDPTPAGWPLAYTHTHQINNNFKQTMAV